MKRLQSFKFELMPDREQERNMRRFAGTCRFVFNRALAWQTAAYEADKTTKFSYTVLANFLPAWKKDAASDWLKASPSQTLQQALKDLERAYKNFFDKRADFPKFKRRGQGDSFRFPQGFNLDQGNSRIFLPKLGWVRFRNSREVLGTAKNITVSPRGGKWFASIQTEREVAEVAHVSTAAVGIDVGITRFATLSDGSFIAPVNSFRKHEHRLRRYQRSMSRKVKFSQNWKKARAKVQRLHTRIGNVRRDFLHKASTTLCREHALICVEDLRVKDMSASAAGTPDAPGRNVRQKSGLNKSILDQGWGEFRRQLEYKSLWAGGQLIAVPSHHTSQRCPCCGHVSPDNRTTQARFVCVECGYENHADVVGAINVLERGLRLLACGEPVQLDRSKKQEPTEATQAVLYAALESRRGPTFRVGGCQEGGALSLS